MPIPSQVIPVPSGQQQTPPFGLVLAGGHSQRMGRSKGTLVYTDSGRCQAERCVRLLSSVCPRVYLSVRADQDSFFEGDRLLRIPDRWEDKGPLGGIVSAMYRAPERAWLVLACDKPFVDAALLRMLVTRRAPSREATAFRIPKAFGTVSSKAFGTAPDPLCAIYEPSLLPRAVSLLQEGLFSPRRLLEDADTRVLDTAENWRLRDVNTPEAYRAVKRVFDTHPQFLGRDV